MCLCFEFFKCDIYFSAHKPFVVVVVVVDFSCCLFFVCEIELKNVFVVLFFSRNAHVESAVILNR